MGYWDGLLRWSYIVSSDVLYEFYFVLHRCRCQHSVKRDMFICVRPVYVGILWLKLAAWYIYKYENFSPMRQVCVYVCTFICAMLTRTWSVATHTSWVIERPIFCDSFCCLIWFNLWRSVDLLAVIYHEIHVKIFYCWIGLVLLRNIQNRAQNWIWTTQ